MNNRPSRPPLISPLNAWIMGGILLALFAAGSLFDLQISTALFNPDNPLGIVGAAYGEYPFSLALLVGGVMLIMFRNRAKTALMVLQVVLGVLVGLIGAVMTIINPARYMPGSPIVTYVINTLIVAGAIWATIYILRGVDRSTAMRVATVVLLVAFVELVIVNVVKIGWERPRMRMLATEPGVAFSPWWSPGTPERDALVQSGVASDDFKSFPSGHTANAAMLMMMTAFTVLKPAWEKCRPCLFWIGAAFAGVVALSRIIMGAHFLTDVTMGCVITFVCILIAYRIAFPAGRRSASASTAISEESHSDH